MMAPQPARIAGRGIADITEKDGDADVGRDMPHPDNDSGRIVFREKAAAIRIVDGSKVEKAGSARSHRPCNPQRDRVALDDLIQRGIDRLDRVIAGGEPVRAGKKKTIGFAGVIGVHDFARYPARLLLKEIVALDPGDRRRDIEGPRSRA